MLCRPHRLAVAGRPSHRSSGPGHSRCAPRHHRPTISRMN